MLNWMNTVYGSVDGQLHYTKIKPCIIAEKLFVNSEDVSHALVDYKIYCFHGVPECKIVVTNREKKKDYNLSLFDLEWNNISMKSFDRNSKHFKEVNVERPQSLDTMIEAAKKLSEGFPQVRVDFYDIEGKAVFGELTFTTGYPPFSEEYFNYLGNKIDLNKAEKTKNYNTI